MITPNEARSLIAQHTPVLQAIEIPTNEALGHCLEANAYSPHDHPIFDQSAMDGYAVRFEDLEKFEQLRVIGELPAGATTIPTLGPGEAVRIFTGSVSPPTADSVVMQEHVNREGDTIKITVPQDKKGKHIRRKGEQIKKGDIALEKGTLLDAAAIGFLASIGVREVSVVVQPTAGIIATGDEFISPEKTPLPGQIFESNGVMLESLLKQSGFAKCERITQKDSLESISTAIKTMANKHNVLLITGGVSVGDYDFTPQALEDAGFKIIFHNINQKPGKPLLFAVRNNCVAFGLPGNPRSVLSCFFQYTLPSLKKLAGNAYCELPQLMVPLAEPIANRSKKALFLFAAFSGSTVVPLTAQQSHMLMSSVNAPAMIETEAGHDLFEKGALVKVHLL